MHTEREYRAVVAERDRLAKQVEAMREALQAVSQIIREGGCDTNWDNTVHMVRAALAAQDKREAEEQP